MFVGHISNYTSDHEDRQTAISTDQSQHSLSSVLHGATGYGFWDRERFHESSHAVAACCGYTKEWCSAFEPHWFLMNHRCCFDFMRSQVWAVDSPFSVERIFVLKKSWRLGGAGAGAVFLRKFHQIGFIPLASGFPMQKAVLVTYGKRLWSHTDSDRTMVLNYCLFLWL